MISFNVGFGLLYIGRQSLISNSPHARIVGISSGVIFQFSINFLEFIYRNEYTIGWKYRKIIKQSILSAQVKEPCAMKSTHLGCDDRCFLWSWECSCSS